MGKAVLPPELPFMVIKALKEMYINWQRKTLKTSQR